jgi:hypothetical protein
VLLNVVPEMFYPEEIACLTSIAKRKKFAAQTRIGAKPAPNHRKVAKLYDRFKSFHVSPCERRFSNKQ